MVKSKRELYNEIAEARYGKIDYEDEPDMSEDIQLILSNTCNLNVEVVILITVVSG